MVRIIETSNPYTLRQQSTIDRDPENFQTPPRSRVQDSRLTPSPNPFTLLNLVNAAELVSRVENQEKYQEDELIFANAIADVLKRDHFPTADQARSWFENPKNQELLAQVEELYLENKGLAHLSSLIKFLPNVYALLLNGNQLKALPDELRHLKALHELDLSQNQFQNFPRIVCRLSNLGILRIKKNELAAIPSAIGKLSELEVLNLADNLLNEKSLQKGFYTLENLQELNLKGNNFKEIPEEIGQLKELIYLNFQDCQIRTLPSGLQNLTELECFVLIGNPLKGILPDSLIDFIHELSEYGFLHTEDFFYIRKKLDSNMNPDVLRLVTEEEMERELSHNNPIWGGSMDRKTTKTPQFFPSPWILPSSEDSSMLAFANGIVESIGHEPFTTVEYARQWFRNPENQQKLQAITSLDLSHRHISILPTEIGKLKKLEELNLESNSLKNLPVSIRNLPHLQRLNLNKNSFKTFPNNIFSLGNLTHLEITNNQLDSLSEQIRLLSQLEFLDIAKNNINELPIELQQLRKLRSLTLTDNPLLATIPTALHPWLEGIIQHNGLLHFGTLNVHQPLESPATSTFRFEVVKDKSKGRPRKKRKIDTQNG